MYENEKQAIPSKHINLIAFISVQGMVHNYNKLRKIYNPENLHIIFRVNEHAGR